MNTDVPNRPIYAKTQQPHKTFWRSRPNSTPTRTCSTHQTLNLRKENGTHIHPNRCTTQDVLRIMSIWRAKQCIYQMRGSNQTYIHEKRTTWPERVLQIKLRQTGYVRTKIETVLWLYTRDINHQNMFYRSCRAPIGVFTKRDGHLHIRGGWEQDLAPIVEWIDRNTQGHNEQVPQFAVCAEQGCVCVCVCAGGRVRESLKRGGGENSGKALHPTYCEAVHSIHFTLYWYCIDSCCEPVYA